jgi:hypothetical protein
MSMLEVSVGVTPPDATSPNVPRRRPLVPHQEAAMHLHGSVGDAVIVDGVHINDPPRRGEIIAVVGTGEAEHFRVRWTDGHESSFFPGATTRIVAHEQDRKAKAKKP